jgi:hypothetical protein
VQRIGRKIGVIDDALQIARDADRGAVASCARFSAMPGSRLAALPPPLQRAAEYIRRHDDMNVHTRVHADHTAGVEDAFVDRFALAGPVERVRPRFVALAACRTFLRMGC